MSETAGNGDQDDTLRYIEEVIKSLRADDIETADDATLRARADGIMGEMPTWTNRMEVEGLHDLADAVGALGEQILEAGINYTVANRYVTPPPPEAVRRPDGYIGALPGERTTRAQCLEVASNPTLARLDDEARAANQALDAHSGDLNDRARVMRERREAERRALVNTLVAWGVDETAIVLPEYGSDVTFTHNGNFVRVSTMNGVTDIVAWSDRLTPEERDQAWEDHGNLVKQGAPLAHIHHYLQTGSVPPHLRYLADRIQEESGDITGAFNEHAQQVRAHAMAAGFRQFQVHSPHLHWGLPIALQILEHPPEDTYPLVGDYSATNGFIAVDTPGAFHRARQEDAGWVITDDGGIDAV